MGGGVKYDKSYFEVKKPSGNFILLSDSLAQAFFSAKGS